MNQLFKNLFLRLLKIYFEDKVALAKIRAVTCYVKAVGEARRFFIDYLLLRFALVLMLTGFALMHVAVFIYLPWSNEYKMIALFILGAVYFFVPFGYVLKMCSQKYWMNMSKADELVKEVTGKK